MSDDRSLRALREEFGKSPFLAMPIAGTIAWTVDGVLGVLAGAMWIPFGWMIEHWVGLFHAIARTALVLGVWFALPRHRFTAVAAAVVLVYLISIWALARRR